MAEQLINGVRRIVSLRSRAEGSVRLAMTAGLLSPLFVPVGLGDWRVVTALITGFLAKESVVSTLEILFGGRVSEVITPSSAASLLVFSLLYAPCVASVAAIRRELGPKWSAGVALWQCVVAWAAALIVNLICRMCGMG